MKLLREIANEQLNGKTLGETKHPINYFFRSDELDEDVADAIYDIKNDVWIKTPSKVDVSDFEGVVDSAVSWARKIDLDKGELWRDVVDYEKIKKVVMRLDSEEKERIKEKLRGKLKEINTDLKLLTNNYETIHRERLKAFDTKLENGEVPSKNWLPENIVYKFLERWNYLQLLKELKKIDTVEEIPKIKEILGQTTLPRNLPKSIPEVQIYKIGERFKDDPKLGTFVSSHKSKVPGVYKTYDIYRKEGYTVYTVDLMTQETDMPLAVNFSTYIEANDYVNTEMMKKAQRGKPLDRFASKVINGIKILYANTDEEITQGLIGVNKEDFQNAVMVFKVTRGTFHMKGVTFPIDIAFIDQNNRILKVASMEPEIGYSNAPEGTELVIEGNIGWFKRNELTKGDVVGFIGKREGKSELASQIERLLQRGFDLDRAINLVADTKEMSIEDVRGIWENYIKESKRVATKIVIPDYRYSSWSRGQTTDAWKVLTEYDGKDIQPITEVPSDIQVIWNEREGRKEYIPLTRYINFIGMTSEQAKIVLGLTKGGKATITINRWGQVSAWKLLEEKEEPKK